MNKVHIVIKIGNSHLVAARFDGDQIVDTLRLDPRFDWKETLFKRLASYPAIDALLIGSVNPQLESEVRQLLEDQPIGYLGEVNTTCALQLQLTHPEHVGADLIGNVYGAYKLFPHQPLIIVDMGTATTFTVAGPEFCLHGGIILPGLEMGATALHEYTHKLPLVPIEKPATYLGKETSSAIQSGLYYGLLSTIRGLTEALTREQFPHEKAVVIATGGITSSSKTPSQYIPPTQVYLDLRKDLEQYVDLIEPNLTLIGFNEILKEKL